MYKSCISFTCISKYFILFGTIMNGTFLLKFICSLLIIITPSLSKLIYSSNFLLNSLVFSTHRIVSSLSKDSFDFFHSSGRFFLFVFCLIAVGPIQCCPEDKVHIFALFPS